MKIVINEKKLFLSVMLGCLTLCILGLIYRFYKITANDFVFYDEGYYLNYNRGFAEILIRHYPSDFSEFLKALYAHIRISLASGKALWFAIVDARIFFGAWPAWFFPRLVSAIVGSLTLFLTYRFARRYYDSAWAAWISAGLLAVLPSHVFYSRVGLQEALSTLLVLAGFYFYLFPRKFGCRTFVAGTIFAAAFFANYRLIILPILIVFCEVYMTLSLEGHFGVRKLVWCLLTFFSGVFLIGNINDGQNTIIIFSWIFHQADMASDKFVFFNLFSYPYYVWRLENGLFALLLLGNIYLVYKRQWSQLLPFLLVCVQMGIFSFTSEKGARYLAVLLPFMVMSVAYLIVFLLTDIQNSSFRIILITTVVLMTGFMIKKSYIIARINSDYRTVTEFLLAKDSNVKFLSTQPYVQNLFMHRPANVESCPYSFPKLLEMSNAGFEYLVLCPQAYISWTDSRSHFDPTLTGYLEFIKKNIKPVKIYPNFNKTMLERFVFEHSQNLGQSIEFLRLADKENFGVIRIYDLKETTKIMLAMLAKYGKDSEKSE